MAEPLKIEFDYVFEGTSRTIHFHALAELHHSQPHYIVKQVAPVDQAHPLPAQNFKKLKGKWVEAESEKETDLSKIVRNAIEKALLYLENPKSGV